MQRKTGERKAIRGGCGGGEGEGEWAGEKEHGQSPWDGWMEFCL